LMRDLKKNVASFFLQFWQRATGRSSRSNGEVRSARDRDAFLGGEGPIGRDEFLGVSARFAVSDGTRIDLHHRDHLGRRAGQEHFVGGVEVVAGEEFLLGGQAHFGGELHHAMARDAVQGPGRGGRGHQVFPLHVEDVVPRAFRHHPFGVQHDRFRRVGEVGLDLGQDVVEVVQGFDVRIQRLRDVPSGGRDGHAQSLFVEGFRIERDGIRDDDHGGARTFPRVQSQVSHAAGHHEPDVGVAQVVGPQSLQHGLLHLVRRHRDLQHDGPGRGIQPVEVFLQTEHASVVGADPLEHAVPVEQAVVEHGDDRFLFGDEFPVDIDQDRGRALPAAAPRRRGFLCRFFRRHWFFSFMSDGPGGPVKSNRSAFRPPCGTCGPPGRPAPRCGSPSPPSCAAAASLPSISSGSPRPSCGPGSPSVRPPRAASVRRSGPAPWRCVAVLLRTSPRDDGPAGVPTPVVSANSRPWSALPSSVPGGATTARPRSPRGSGRATGGGTGTRSRSTGSACPRVFRPGDRPCRSRRATAFPTWAAS